MRLHKRIEEGGEAKRRMRQKLAPYITTGEEKKFKLSPRAISAIACMLVVIVTLSVLLPVTLNKDGGAPQNPDLPPATSPEEEEEPPRYSYSETDYKMTTLSYYINPLYVGEEYADQNNFGLFFDEYCAQNDLEILHIPRNAISEYYADEHIVWRNSYVYTHKEDPSLTYWAEEFFSLDAPNDSLRRQMSIKLYIMPKNLSLSNYQVGEHYVFTAMVNGVEITYSPKDMREIKDDSGEKFAYKSMAIEFVMGDYKYFARLYPKTQPQEYVFIRDAFDDLAVPDLSAVQIYIEDILSTAK